MRGTPTPRWSISFRQLRIFHIQLGYTYDCIFLAIFCGYNPLTNVACHPSRFMVDFVLRKMPCFTGMVSNRFYLDASQFFHDTYHSERNLGLPGLIYIHNRHDLGNNVGKAAQIFQAQLECERLLARFTSDIPSKIIIFLVKHVGLTKRAS